MKSGESSITYNLVYESPFISARDCLCNRFDSNEWFNITCGECANHVLNTTKITSEPFTKEEAELWRAFFPNKIQLDKENIRKICLDEEIRKKIIEYRVKGILEKIEIWKDENSNELGIVKNDLIVVGLREGKIYLIGSQNNNNCHKTLSDVKKELYDTAKNRLNHLKDHKIRIATVSLGILLSLVFWHIYQFSGVWWFFLDIYRNLNNYDYFILILVYSCIGFFFYAIYRMAKTEYINKRTSIEKIQNLCRTTLNR